MGEGLVCASEDAHHLDEGGETGEGGPMPEKLYGTLAPGTGNEESMIKIALRMEVFKDVNENFWRDV